MGLIWREKNNNSGAKARENPKLIFYALLYYLNVLDFNCRTGSFIVFGRVIEKWHNLTIKAFLTIKKSTWPLELACLVDE